MRSAILIALAACTQSAVAAQYPRIDTLHAVPDLAISHPSIADGINWIGVFKDGSIAVQPSGIHPGVRFSPAGAFVAVVTGSDEPALLHGFVHDSVWGADRQSSVVSVLGVGASSGRKFDMPTVAQLPSGDAVDFGPAGALGNSTRPLAMMSNGDVIAYGFPRSGVPTKWRRPVGARSVVFRMSSSGIVRSFIGWDFPLLDPPDGITWPFQSRPLRSLAPDGSLVAFARAETSGPDSGQIQIIAVKATGDTQFAVRIPYVARKISQFDTDSAIASRIALSPKPEWADKVRASARPTIYAPITSMIVGSDDQLWLKATPEGTHVNYMVIDTLGRFTKVVQIPTGMTVLAVREGVIWAVQRDSARMVSLQRLRVGPTH